MKIFIRNLTIIVLGAVLANPVLAVVIDLRSGNGSIGGTDSQINFLQGPQNQGFGSAFTVADFAAARAGAAAVIINKHSAWASPTKFALGGGDASAQWISDNASGEVAGSTALYAIDFFNTFDTTTSATLDFYWAVDNYLGDSFNDGVFINGQALGITGGEFSEAYSSLNIDVSSLLVSGVNTLYINTRDVGGPSGLMFSASLDVQGTMTPVPAPAGGLFALGLLGLVCRTLFCR